MLVVPAAMEPASKECGAHRRGPSRGGRWLRFDPLRDVGVGGAAVGRVVFEAAVFGGIVRGRDDDAVGGQAARCVRDCR